jgi:hypothetical protein
MFPEPCFHIMQVVEVIAADADDFAADAGKLPCKRSGRRACGCVANVAEALPYAPVIAAVADD